MSARKSRGVLLINLGTPDSPTTKDVRDYLREFLSDPLVIDMHPLARALLLHGYILRTRPAHSAAAYRRIWTPQGSPLLVHGRALCDGLRHELPDHLVELAMRYGNPTIAAAIERMAAEGCDQILVVPLYPQYARSSTLSTVVRVDEVVAGLAGAHPLLRVLPPFYDHPQFIDALARTCAPRLAELRPDQVLMSFHGLPERHLPGSRGGSTCLASGGCCDEMREDNRGCYRAQCWATARILARRLNLADRFVVAFQSRLGRAKWIEPYTDIVVGELARGGVRRLAVICPSFVADCLETLEEIGLRARAQFIEAGGESLDLVPCLNSDPAWISALGAMIREDAEIARLA